MFSYSGRVKSSEWRWQRRRANLRHFAIFRHRPIIVYTRLPAGGTYYPICTFPASSECLIGISDAFSTFVYGYPSSCSRAHCTPQQMRDYSALHPQAWTCIYIQAMPVGTYRVQSPGFPKIVYCCSTAVLGQSHAEEQLEAKEVQLSQPSSTSLLTISSGLT